MKTYQQPDDKETKQFGNKILERKEHNRKTEWINNTEKELKGIEKCPKAKILLDYLKAILKKRPNLKTPDCDGIHGYRFKKITSKQPNLKTPGHEEHGQRLKNSLPSTTDWLSK